MAEVEYLYKVIIPPGASAALPEISDTLEPSQMYIVHDAVSARE